MVLILVVTLTLAAFTVGTCFAEGPVHEDHTEGEEEDHDRGH